LEFILFFSTFFFLQKEEGLRKSWKSKNNLEMIQHIKLNRMDKKSCSCYGSKNRTLHNNNDMKIVRHYEHWMERYEDQYQDDDDQY